MSMKPACAIDEYASSRLMFVCTMAARFPTASETHAMTANAIVHRSAWSGNATTSSRSASDERRRLRGSRHEGRDGSRRTFVDVRRPHVERRRRHLEPEADDDHRQAGQQEEVVAELLLRRGRCDFGEAELPRCAVDERRPEEQHRRAEAADDEVLEAGLQRALTTLTSYAQRM